MSSIKFFFPDSHDYVDPSFDFIREQGNEHRIRQRDDHYPHEVFSTAPYDGMLISKAIVDGTEKGASKYTVAQRQRFFRQGAKRFMHMPEQMPLMGDCGAFSYVAEYEPPYSVDEVAEFYEIGGFDLGISVDHIIFAFEAQAKVVRLVEGDELTECLRRRELTLTLADEFFKRAQGCGFTPMGVAHGWNPESMAESVVALQKMGYQRITLGGLVPLKTVDILRVLEACDGVRNSGTEFHLLGISRVENVEAYQRYGVSSFDSTSPLQQAFKDARHNYHTASGETYVALRVPQVDGNPALMRAIKSGKVDQDKARVSERLCLKVLREFDRGLASQQQVMQALADYEAVMLVEPKKSFLKHYERTLEAQPWKQCPCDICQQIGIDVAMFRGAERNRRRGFHNIFVLHEKLKLHLSHSGVAQ